MPPSDFQTFLRELDKNLWTAADQKGAQASRLFLQKDKATGKMPMLPYKITSTGKLINDALEASEKENPNEAERHRRPSNVAQRARAAARINLKGVLDRRCTQLQIDPSNLSSRIDLIASIPFQHADLHARDNFGQRPSSNHPSFSSAL